MGGIKMKKAQAFSEIRVAFCKEFDSLNRKEILDENTYLYTSLPIKEVEVKLTMYGGKVVIVDLKDILNWEVEFDDVYVDDEILD